MKKLYTITSSLMMLFAMVFFAHSSHAIEKININTADVKTITKSLRGIGKKKAEAIVALREKQGKFKSLDELVKIRGISKKTIEGLKDKVAIGTHSKL